MIESQLEILGKSLQQKIVTDSTDTYILQSTIWTAETVSSWSILKVDTNWNIFYPVKADTWLPTQSFTFLPANVLTLEYQYWPYMTWPTIDTFTVDDWDLWTTSRTVTVQITSTSYLDIVWYSISEDANDETFSSTLPTTFELSSWLETKTIYLKLKDAYWNISTTSSTSIILTDDVTAPSLVSYIFGSVAQWASFTGKSITFDEEISTVDFIRFINDIWTVVATLTWVADDTDTITFSWTAPNVAEVYIEVSVKDLVGNTTVLDQTNTPIWPIILS